MHLVDVLIMAVLAIGAVRGYMTGLFRQVGAVVGVLLAFFFAAGLMTGVGARLTEWMSLESDTGPVLGFIAVFVLVFVVVLLITRFAEAAFTRMELGTFNHVVGAITGGLVAALLMSTLLVAVSYVGIPSASTRRASHLYGPTAGLAPVAWSYMSSNRETFRALTDRLNLEHLNEWVGPAHRAPKPPPPKRYQRPSNEG